MNPLRIGALLAIRFYRGFLSPAKIVLFGPTAGCRFIPSCSAFALEAIEQHGLVDGSTLTLKRLCRCHPWGGAGFDPVPACGRVESNRR